MPSASTVPKTGVATRCLVALVSSAASGFFVPLFAGIISVMLMPVIGVPDTIPRWIGVLVAGSLVSGCIAVALARSQLCSGWVDTGRSMWGPYALASLVFAGLALAARRKFLAPGVFEEGSPYLATALYGMTAFAESALGAFVLSVVLGARLRR